MPSEITNTENDRAARERIVSETDRNFFVEAGAGSGKTTMLVNRMVAMVEAGIDISKICAITFTKAAAGEFYERFQRLLIQRSIGRSEDQSTDISSDANKAICENADVKMSADRCSDTGVSECNANRGVDRRKAPGQLPEPTEVTRERCTKALKDLDLCFMGTIDAFCSMILSEHPFDARIPSDADIVTKEEACNIYRQQFVKISNGDYGEDLSGLAAGFRAFYRNTEEVFVHGMSFLMDKRNVHFNFKEATGTNVLGFIAAERDPELINAVKCLLEHPELKYEGNKEKAAAWDRLGDAYKIIKGSWAGNISNVMYGLKLLKDLPVIKEAVDRYPVELGGVLSPAGKQGRYFHIKALQEGGLLERLQELQYSVSISFLMKCVPVMENVMRDSGRMGFFDYLYYLREMLKDDASKEGKLIRYISERHSYYLIDEFQDTNPLQAEIFFYLSAQNPVPEWKECEPRKGSLFIVGDPKQSIYRFRGADVASFLKVKKIFEEKGGEILYLSSNFRSTRTLCKYFNNVFTGMLPEETREQSKFEPIPLSEMEDKGFGGIFTYKAYTGQSATVHPEETDPIRIADIIESLVNNEKYMITKKQGEPEKISYGDIMVITYNKKSLAPIMEELDIRGIPAKVEGDVPFAENEALREVYLIYSAVADPQDETALYGALTGKVFAISDGELLAYKSSGGKLSLKHEPNSDEAYANVTGVCRALEKLRDLHRQSFKMSPAALFSKITDDMRVFVAVDGDNLEVLLYALELVRTGEKTGQIMSHRDAARFIAGLISGVSGEERCLSLMACDDRVHMANLHKVKGLEAPVVILAAASAKSRSADSRIDHGAGEPEGFLFSLKEDRSDGHGGTAFFTTSGFADENEAEKETLKAEKDRLVYVAATRAANALILCNSVYERNGKEISGNMWKPLIEGGAQDFFDNVEMRGETGCDEPECADAAGLYEKGENECALKERQAEEATFTEENPSLLKRPSEGDEGSGQEAESPELISNNTSMSFRTNVSNPMDLSKHADPELISDNTSMSFRTNARNPQGNTDVVLPKRQGLSAAIGTMTHRLMEALVSSKNSIDAKEAVAWIIRECAKPETEGLEDTITTLLEAVADKMRNGGYPQSNGQPQDMLQVLLNADEVYCEVPFAYKEEREGETVICKGVMDLVYLAERVWHILDYKTNADGSDLDKKYEGQLGAYVKAFKEITGNDALAGTYHIDV